MLSKVRPGLKFVFGIWKANNRNIVQVMMSTLRKNLSGYLTDTDSIGIFKVR
jgi:hypothetical protein